MAPVTLPTVIVHGDEDSDNGVLLDSPLSDPAPQRRSEESEPQP
jgi:hypothetical protein